MSRMIQEKIKRDLASLCEYRKGKVSVEQLNKNTYKKKKRFEQTTDLLF